MPQRVAAYLGRTPPLLPPEDAGVWARAFLRPLGSTPRATLDITRLAVTFPRSAVARLLDFSRNTVRARLRAAEHLLSRDLLTTVSGIHDLVHALHITGLPPAG
jgi:hypothetical protein